MSLAGVRNELRKIRTELVPPGRRIVGALAWEGHVREIIRDSGMNSRCDMSVTDLPPDCCGSTFRAVPTSSV